MNSACRTRAAAILNRCSIQSVASVTYVRRSAVRPNRKRFSLSWGLPHFPVLAGNHEFVKDH